VKVRGNARFMFLAILILNLAIACVVMVFPQGTADVTIQPARVEDIWPGESFTVDITVTGAEDIQGWEANITFDPTVLEVVNASEGEFLKSMFATFYSYYAPEDAGYIYVAASYFFVMAPGLGVSGNGILANITFQVRDIGNSPMHFKEEETVLWYNNGTALDQQPRNLIDGFFTNLHDVAVTNLTASPDIVNLGEPVSINVTVTNKGDISETLDVTTYWNIGALRGMIGTNVTSLDGGMSTLLRLTWPTTGICTGTYTISAEASVVLGENYTADNTLIDGEVTVNATGQPEAKLTYSPIKPKVGENITFTSTSTDPDGTIVSWDWTFDDESIGSGEVVIHAYAETGTYKVTLNVTDNDGLCNIVWKSVSVLSYPVASFTYSPEAPLVNHPVTFNASSSKPNGGTIVSYAWDFGDSTSETYEGENLTAIATHTYVANGTFTVTLNVTDDEGLSKTASKNITTVREHDIAVVDLDYGHYPDAKQKPTTVYAGGSRLGVKVTVKNEGSEMETFDILLYCDNTEITTLKVTDLAPLEERTVTSETGWVLTNLSSGEHYLKAEVPPGAVPGETDLADNSEEIGPIFLQEINVAVIDVVLSKTTVLAGDVSGVNVTVQNKGTGPSPRFLLTVYYNMSTLSISDSTQVSPLEKDAVETKVFTWNTTDAAPANYILSAYITPITTPATESDIEDNLFIYGDVTIGASIISIYTFPKTITVGSIAILNGSITPTRPGVNVTIKYRLSEEETWNNITTVTTDENSTYSYDWTPQSVGTYEIKASWEGDMYTLPSESGILTIMVSSTSPSVFLYVGAAAAAIAIVAIAIYLLKFRKPKQV
jgi:PKD repeat protein